MVIKKEKMILDRIVERKQKEVAELHKYGIDSPGMEVGSPRGFLKSLFKGEGVAIIAEVKKASPSKGVICPDFDPVKISKSYKQGGASGVSVLTDRDFFQGSMDYLVQVRAAIDLPVLRKDFIIDSLQVDEASTFGADAILLIAAILDTIQLRDFHQQAEGLGMDVLVEVHDEYELESALRAESRLIGVNNRNLQDFTVDLETTFRLKKEVPSGIPLVSESGISSVDDIRKLLAHGVQAALIGESLMRKPGDVSLLAEFVKAHENS